VKRFD